MNQTLNVLFIEDNLDDARLVQEELCPDGAKTSINLEWVERLEKGLGRLAQGNVQAVLLDLTLPDSEGLDTLQSVIACAPQIPVIVMTGQANEEAGMLALQAGAQDYLVKGQVDGRLMTRAILYAIHRKQTELQLAEAREFTQRIVSSSPVGIFTYRLSGECLSVNVAAAQMVGGTVEQLRDQNFHHLESWKRSGLYEMARETIGTGKPTKGDIYVVTTFGREAWYTAQFVLFRSGGEDLLLMMFSDITERKRSEAELREREEMLRRSQEIAHVGSWDIDLLSNRITWSHEIYHIFGMDTWDGVATYETFFDNVHPDDRAAVAATYSEALREGLSRYEIEHRIIRRDTGEVRFLHTKCENIKNVSGAIVRLVGIVQDITEHKQAEAALATSEKRFRTWIEHSSDIITVMDAGGIVQYASPSVERLLGYEPEELLGKNAFEFIHPEDQDRIIAAFVENIQDLNAVVSAEFRFRHKDGSWRFLGGIGHFYVDEHDEVVGLIHSRDITERKQAEAEVAAIQKRFQALIENAPDGIALLGLDGKLRQVTPSTQQILGYTLEEAEGHEPALLTHPDDLPALLGLLNDLIQNPKKVIRTQYRFLHKDGSWRWLESIITNLIAEPSVQSIVFNYREITERKQAEEKIQYQANLLANVNDAIISTNSNYVLTSWNAAAETMYGWKAEEVLGRSGVEIIQTQWAEASGEEMRQAIAKRGAWRGEATQLRKDGTRIPVEISSMALRAENGDVTGYVSVVRDISRRKRAEEALRESEERFRILVHSMNDVVFTLDREQRHTGVFGAWVEKAGLTPEAFLGKTVREILGDEEAPVHEEANRRALAGETVTYEWSAAGTHGTQYTQTSLSPLRDPGGLIIGVVGVGRDITDRKQAEESLKEKEHLLTEAQHIGRIGSWSYDILNDSMTFSDEMYRLLDVLPDEFQHDSQDFLALVYPSDRPMATKWMADIKDGTQAEDFNFRLFHKNGELCYLYCTGVVEFDAAAKPSRFIGTAQDVTERRVAEIQINQQIKRLMALSEIDRAIISSFDQRYTLGVILSQMISQLQVDAARVLILDKDEEMLEYVAGQGFRTKVRETTHLRLGEGHAGRAAKERRMIRIADLRETTNDLAFSQLVISEEFVSYIAAPLIVKGKVKGVLEVFQRSLLQPYQDWIDFFNTLTGQTAIAIESTSLFANLQASNRELIQAYEATIEGWSRAMDLRDRETEGHTQRVTKLTLELACSMGIDDSKLVHIRRGALLHDIGKLGVPDHILFKPGELTVEERKIIEQHVDFAYEMLAPIPYLKPALHIPYFHHEKWDGTGYPLGLKSEQIPLEARIFALVDVWDALLSDRPYRKAWRREDVIEYIRARSGTHFDPRVVEHFLEVIKRID